MAVASRRNSVALGIVGLHWRSGYANSARVRTETGPGWLAGRGTPVLLEIHQAIFDAVAAGDAGAAQAAVLRHHEVMLEQLRP
jgi:DNA-binding FadR family transcriptional regulator